jgi:hypothetical protein
VPAGRARDISGLVALIRERAERTPAGEWIITAAAWHEGWLAERRLPTAAELDRATGRHPVFVMRGGHNAVLNTPGLRLAGITRQTADPPGGHIARDASGEPTGWLQGAAMIRAQRSLPPLSTPALADALERASSQYAAHGIGTVRDPAVAPAEWHAYLDAPAGREAGRTQPGDDLHHPGRGRCRRIDGRLAGLARSPARPERGSQTREPTARGGPGKRPGPPRPPRRSRPMAAFRSGSCDPICWQWTSMRSPDASAARALGRRRHFRRN